MSLISDKIKLKNEIVEYRGAINDPEKVIELNALLIELRSVVNEQQFLAMEDRFNVVKASAAQIYDIKPATAEGTGACIGPWCAKIKEEGEGQVNIESEYFLHEDLLPTTVPPPLELGAGYLGPRHDIDSAQSDDSNQSWSWEYGFAFNEHTIGEELDLLVSKLGI